MEDQQLSVNYWPVKIAMLWASIGVSSWSDVAAFFACIYSFLLIVEWFFKNIIRPYMVSRGWLNPKNTFFTAKMDENKDADQ